MLFAASGNLIHKSLSSWSINAKNGFIEFKKGVSLNLKKISESKQPTKIYRLISITV
jgi:hypothetical protein